MTHHSLTSVLFPPSLYNPTSSPMASLNDSSSPFLPTPTSTALPFLPHTASWSDALYCWFFLPYFWNEVVFWLAALVFASLDFLSSPSSLSHQKLQPHRLPASTPPKVTAYYAAAYQSISNHILGSIPVTLTFTACAHSLQLPAYGPLPSFLVCLYQVAVMVAVEEVGFYYLHRLLHLPFFYQRIHYIHHEWVAPVAVSATTCHLLEHIFCNVGPMLVGVLIARAHWQLLMGWSLLATLNTCCVHSGYSWAWLKAENHDRHHSTNKCAFGAVGVLDWLHGTRYSDLLHDKGDE